MRLKKLQLLLTGMKSGNGKNTSVSTMTRKKEENGMEVKGDTEQRTKKRHKKEAI